MENENITKELFSHLENKNTKIAERILNYLSLDRVCVYRDGQIESVSTLYSVPDYVYVYIKKWYKNNYSS